MRQILYSALALCAIIAAVNAVSTMHLHEPDHPMARQVFQLERDSDSLTVASFNLQGLGENKLDKPQVMDILTRIIRQFDVVAVQEVRARRADVMPRLVSMINADGAKYDYVVGPRLGRTSNKEQFAYLYDTERLQLDRSCVYTAEDRGDLLHREPLVSRFVAQEIDSGGFSFTLVNIHTDRDDAKAELAAMTNIVRAVQNNASREDDVILLGDFNLDEHHVGAMVDALDLTFAVSGVPTNTRGNHTLDNIAFNRHLTQEFTGRAGVYDFMHEFGLTLDEALQISDHLPVWAQFTIHEGGLAESLARREKARSLQQAAQAGIAPR